MWSFQTPKSQNPGLKNPTSIRLLFVIVIDSFLCLTCFSNQQQREVAFCFSKILIHRSQTTLQQVFTPPIDIVCIRIHLSVIITFETPAKQMRLHQWYFQRKLHHRRLPTV